MSIVIVHCTCAADGSAERIAQALVEERLAACVSVMPKMTSVYRWQAEVHTDQEVLLLIKTTRETYPGPPARLSSM